MTSCIIIILLDIVSLYRKTILIRGFYFSDFLLHTYWLCFTQWGVFFSVQLDLLESNISLLKTLYIVLGNNKKHNIKYFLRNGSIILWDFMIIFDKDITYLMLLALLTWTNTYYNFYVLYWIILGGYSW